MRGPSFFRSPEFLAMVVTFGLILGLGALGSWVDPAKAEADTLSPIVSELREIRYELRQIRQKLK